MDILGPVTNVEADCERVLRTLPDWFGFEDSLLEYAHNTTKFPTFVAQNKTDVIAFLSLQKHFAAAWEVNCVGVDARHRGKGVGRALQQHAETWLLAQGARSLQVKTLAAAHPSPHYAQTRAFYERMGYLPIEVFPTLWDPRLPVLQLLKPLGPAA